MNEVQAAWTGSTTSRQPEDHLAEEPSYIPYLTIYEGLSSKAKPAGFILMIVWLAFLFAFVGIVASDFFCPNLSTIASGLGLSESVAGVTFLGLGNGSPDVFSTFAAMRAGTGPLAIGELLGAAAFITSVVAGSMTLIRPFRVPRHSFLRDVGFFTLAVIFTIVILFDGHIEAWEAGSMVLLYCFYVLVVAMGSWWLRVRKRRLETLRKARSEYAEEGEEVEYRDDPDFPTQPGLTPDASTGRRRPSLHQRGSEASASSILSSPHLVPIEFPLIRSTSLDNPSASTQLDIADEAALLDMAEEAAANRRSRNLSSLPSAHPGGRLRLPSSNMGRRGTTGSDSPILSPSSARPGGPLSARPGGRHRHSTAVGHTSIRPSLLGAIEFRDVVNSLALEAAARGARPSALLFGSADSVPGLGGRPRSNSYSGIHHRTVSAHPDFASTEDAEEGPSGRLAGGSDDDLAGMDRRRAVSSSTNWARSRGHRSAKSAVVPKVKPPWHWEQQTTPSAAVQERSEPDWSTSTSAAAAGGGGPFVGSTSAGRIPPDALSVEDPWRDATPARKQHLRLEIPTPERSRSPMPVERTAIPSIMVTGDTGGEPTPVSPASRVSDASAPGVNPLFAPSKRHRTWIIVKTVFAVLFPSLQGLPKKSWIGRIAAVITAPAILLLNLTLPVVDYDGSESDSEDGEKDDEEAVTDEEDEDLENGSPKDLGHSPRQRDHDIAAVLHSPADFSHHDHHSAHPANGQTPFHATAGTDLTPLELPPSQAELWDGPTDSQITRVVAAVQCFLCPLFCVLALTGDDLKWWYFPAAVGLGLVLGGLSYVFLKDLKSRLRLILCFVGFFVAMVWILTIVDEVVGVLQCVGHVFGLSDAILGLTIFAMGNSLGDLVADVTVARMGFPVMAMSACFGGPMLNVLLGIGLSSSYIIASSGRPIKVTPTPTPPTLIVSAIGLLVVLVATLIIVPLNGFLMSRKLGLFLIFAYCVVLCLNIIVEVFVDRGSSIGL